MVININKIIYSNDVKNLLFEKSLKEVKEFPYYLTRYEDIETDVFKNEFLRKRSNGDILRFSHYGDISKDVLYNDFLELSKCISSLNHNIFPVIFYSGNRKLQFYSIPIIGNINYDPLIIDSNKVDGNMRMLNLNYKCSFGEKLDVLEVLDLVWLPSYNNRLSMSGVLKECILIYNCNIIPENLMDYVKYSIKLWIKSSAADELLDLME